MELNAPKLRGDGRDWLRWQLADSAFPVGSFAHSGGLESAWQQGEVAARAELAGFIESSLLQCARGAVPFLTTAFRESQRLLELDWLCDAFLANHVANRASRQQGHAFLVACERAFDLPTVAKLRGQLAQDNSPGHLAPCFGAAAALLGLELEEAVRLFLFLHLRGLLASAVRLGLVGPLEAQGLQHQLSFATRAVGASLNASEGSCVARPVAELAALRALEFGLEDIAQTAPILDLLQGAQDRLYSRLFQS